MRAIAVLSLLRLVVVNAHACTVTKEVYGRGDAEYKVLAMHYEPMAALFYHSRFAPRNNSLSPDWISGDLHLRYHSTNNPIVGDNFTWADAKCAVEQHEYHQRTAFHWATHYEKYKTALIFVTFAYFQQK